jgi:hypothetical protein
MRYYKVIVLALAALLFSGITYALQPAERPAQAKLEKTCRNPPCVLVWRLV